MQENKRKKRLNKSIDNTSFPKLIHAFAIDKNKKREMESKKTIQHVHQAFIYGVQLTQVPTLNKQFEGFKKNIKVTKNKKDLRKTLKYFNKIEKANKKLLISVSQ